MSRATPETVATALRSTWQRQCVWLYLEVERRGQLHPLGMTVWLHQHTFSVSTHTCLDTCLETCLCACLPTSIIHTCISVELCENGPGMPCVGKLGASGFGVGAGALASTAEKYSIVEASISSAKNAHRTPCHACVRAPCEHMRPHAWHMARESFLPDRCTMFHSRRTAHTHPFSNLRMPRPCASASVRVYMRVHTCCVRVAFLPAVGACCIISATDAACIPSRSVVAWKPRCRDDVDSATLLRRGRRRTRR